MQYNNLPLALKSKNNWILADDAKVPMMVSGTTGELFKINPAAKQATYYTFEKASSLAVELNMALGYVLRDDDNLICIDIDIKQDTMSRVLAEEYAGLIRMLGTYTEISQSGRGIHLWLHGYTGVGRRDKKYEVYSKDRYIICTGDSLEAVEVSEHGLDFIRGTNPVQDTPRARQLVNDIINNMSAYAYGQVLDYMLNDIKGDRTDKEILDVIRNSKSEAHRLKFEQLYDDTTRYWNDTKDPSKGAGVAPSWQSMPLDSHSDADMSLITILCFYTNSDPQVYRLFKESRLYRAPPLKDKNYVGRSIVTARRKLKADNPPKNISNCINSIVDSWYLTNPDYAPALPINIDVDRSLNHIVDTYHKLQSISSDPLPADVTALVQSTQVPDIIKPPADSRALTERVQYIAGMVVFNDEDFTGVASTGNELPWPPGLVGELAKYLFMYSKRPFREGAIAGALRIVSSLASRAYNVPTGGSGLNLYVTLLAPTAAGKGVMADSFEEVARLIPDAHYRELFEQAFVNSDVGSAEALRRLEQERLCLSLYINEIGKVLRAYANDRPRGAVFDEMLQVYDRSGEHKKAGGRVLAKKDNSFDINAPVALNVFADNTPKDFFDNIPKHMFTDGSMGRMILIGYDNEREFSYTNYNGDAFSLPQNLINIIGYLISAYQRNKVSFPADGKLLAQQVTPVIKVGWTNEAEQAYLDFDNRCTAAARKQYSGGSDDLAAIYPRLPLNALRVASNLAVMDNHIQPTISTSHMEWAISLAYASIKVLSIAKKEGHTGTLYSKRYRYALTGVSNLLTRKFQGGSTQRTQKAHYLKERNIIRYADFKNYLSRDKFVSYFDERQDIPRQITAQINELISDDILTRLTDDEAKDVLDAMSNTLGIETRVNLLLRVNVSLLNFKLDGSEDSE